MSTSKMPRPPFVNYDDKFEVKDAFIKDINHMVEKAKEEGYSFEMGEEIIKKVEECDRVFTIARLNELITKLSFAPYRYIANIVAIIQNKQDMYFIKKD